MPTAKAETRANDLMGGKKVVMAPLKFEYDEEGDILYIDKVSPYPDQETEQLEYNVIARRSPRTGAIENLEVLSSRRGS